MKLLFVHENFGAQGGAEVNVLLTAQGLQHRGHHVALVSGASTGRNEEPWRETFPTRHPMSELKTGLREFNPDAVYLHSSSDLDAVETLAKAAIPVVRMVHDHNLYCMRSYKYHYFSRKVCQRACSAYCVFPCGASIARGHGTSLPLRWVSYRAKKRELALNRRFQRMFVASEYMKAELLRNGFAENRIEIHPYPLSRTIEGASTFGKRNLILYTGQILRGKGVDVLLEALALVREPFECVIIGEGNFHAHCERLSARLGLADRVKFTGFVPQAELASYFQEASVAVMSSVWAEPFGMAGIEALAQGVPVVAFNSGGIPEWLLDGVNGFVVPWMDRPAFAARIGELLRDKSLAKQMGELGRQWVADWYDVEHYLSGLERSFEALVPTSNPRGNSLTQAHPLRSEKSEPSLEILEGVHRG